MAKAKPFQNFVLSLLAIGGVMGAGSFDASAQTNCNALSPTCSANRVDTSGRAMSDLQRNFNQNLSQAALSEAMFGAEGTAYLTLQNLVIQDRPDLFTDKIRRILRDIDDFEDYGIIDVPFTGERRRIFEYPDSVNDAIYDIRQIAGRAGHYEWLAREYEFQRYVEDVREYNRWLDGNQYVARNSHVAQSPQVRNVMRQLVGSGIAVSGTQDRLDIAPNVFTVELTQPVGGSPIAMVIQGRDGSAYEVYGLQNQTIVANQLISQYQYTVGVGLDYAQSIPAPGRISLEGLGRIILNETIPATRRGMPGIFGGFQQQQQGQQFSSPMDGYAGRNNGVVTERPTQRPAPQPKRSTTYDGNPFN